MATDTYPTTGNQTHRRHFLILLACLLAVMATLFHEALLPGRVIFNNDAPLGAKIRAADALPGGFAGQWDDANWLGAESPAASTDLSYGFLWLAGPWMYAKFWAPASLIILGLSAFYFFRELKLAPLACILGGLAAALNPDPFGNACWGQVSRPLALAASFLALGALQARSGRHVWIKVMLAGMAVGLSILESFDVGAIFSVFVAAYVFYQAWVSTDQTPARRLGWGLVRLILVAGFAAFIASQTIVSLVGTQVKGIVGTEQDQKTKEERWDWATQWSMPKVETLGFVVPGLFGYRMDTPNGGNYWGTCGQTPGWEQHHQGFARYGGGGAYPGILVLAIATWGLLQSFRRNDSPFTLVQRKFIWFWAGLGVVCLLLAWGRHAPFYQWFYALPYVSTMRNPVKFTHIITWAVTILFAYGVHGLVRCYLVKPSGYKAGPFERKWLVGSVVAFVAVAVGWVIYNGSRRSLENYLQTVAFDAGTAVEIASFSIRSVGIFVMLLAVALGLLSFVIRGKFAGPGIKLAGPLLGLFLTVDLMRVNFPSVITHNWKEKYVEAGDNPMITFLAQGAFQHRVAVLPFQPPQPQLGLVNQVYNIEWLQHLFPYFNIQSLDIVQMPRVPADVAAFEGALRFDGTPENFHRLTRRWQLTNTRYLVGAAGFVQALNQQIDPQQRFRPVMLFEFFQTREGGPILARTNSAGPFALFEFTGALPRAALYSHWQVNTNDDATLKLLASPEFDPAQTVLVAEPLPASTAANQSAGSVEFVSYAPTHITLKAQVATPAVLLLNDRYDPKWKVTVDGKPAPLLRCNYVMRGVALPVGEHRVEFRFEPSKRSLFISLAAILLALLAIGYLWVVGRREGDAAATQV